MQFSKISSIFTEARCVDDGEELAGGVAQPVALVSTRPLGDAVQSSAHFEAAIVKTSPIVVLVSAHQDIGQAGLADPSRPEDDNTRTRIPGMSSLRGFYRKISYFSQFVTEGSQLLLVLASPRF